MKKLITGATLGTALLLFQVMPAFAVGTHLEEAQMALQQAVCMFDVAAHDNMAADIDMHTNQGIMNLHTAHEHLKLGMQEDHDMVTMMMLRYIERLMQKTHSMAETVLMSANVYKHARAMFTSQFAHMANEELMKIVNVTGGACG